jgi:phage tail sheath protein FI
MPEYLSPGVYVEEVDTGSKPIEGVSTSTAGFVGVTQRGPVEGPPVLVTSFTEFRRTFGSYLSEDWGDSRFLAYAVKGFFDNEGQRVYIKRVPGENALRSTLNVPDGIVLRLQADMTPGPTQARLTSLRGIGLVVGANVTFRETVGGVTFSDTVSVATYDATTNRISWVGALPRPYSMAGTSVEVRAPSGTTLTVRARDHGKWGDDVSVKFEYTTPSRSELVSSFSLTLGATTARRLTFAAGGPAPTDATTTFGAGEGTGINVNDLIEFDDGGGAREVVRVTNIPGADQIDFLPAVTADFSVGGATARHLMPVQPLTLATGPDPVGNPAQATLGAGEGVLVNVGDTVEFGTGGTTERRALTAVAGDVISWNPADPIENDYTGGGGTVRMVSAARAGDLWLLVPAVAGLQVGDAISITGAGQTEQVTVGAAWNGTSRGIPLDPGTPVVNNYLDGAALGLATAAVRVGANTIRVRSSRSFYPGALIELDNGTDREYFLIDTITGNDMALLGVTTNAYDVNHLVRLAEFKMSVRYQNAAEGVNELEAYEGLSMNPTATTKYVVNVVNAKSNLITVTDAAGPAVLFDSPTTVDGSWQNLGGGDDGTPPLDEAFIGDDLGPGLRTGIQALTDIDQVSIVAVPGKTSQPIIDALIIHCESLMDRFAVIDAPEDVNIQEVQDYRSQYDTKYAAIYYPWITVRDPLVRDNRNIPPSGHMIGIYARVDVERGVHKAPANEVIRGIVDLEQLINKREQDILNPSPVNINVLRDFRKSNRGLRVWGARCITSDTDWKYVNVRRLFIFVEESIDEGTQWVVFEPNDEPLWARVRQSVTNFLTRVWRDGALQGATAEEAFFVKCDRTTMTQDDIDNGRLIMLIGIAAVKPAEFVIIRIGQKAGGAEVEEL